MNAFALQLMTALRILFAKRKFKGIAYVSAKGRKLLRK